MDITYIGNISKDKVLTKNNEVQSSIGGSAIYSSFATKFVNNKLDIGVIGNTTKDYIEVINKSGITFLGKQTSNNTEFFINELEGTCIGKKYNNISFSGNLTTEHLHISFRTGIDIDKIIRNKNISFNSLSIDVMIHSVKNFILKIKEYEDKIDILFCNLSEYQVLKEYIKNIPLVVVTNNRHPVIVKEKERISIANVKECKKIISDTGAGDSFIGGFLGEYLKNKDVNNAVNAGIVASNLSLSNIGPLQLNKNSISIKKIKLLELPSNIIVLGNSCAGKSTFVNEFNKYFDIYSNIDDLDPLLEVFDVDDRLREDKKQLFDKKFNENIKFCRDILEQYKEDYPEINFYTNLSKNSEGHDILRPILWDKIIEYSLINNDSSNKIIQFARGRDRLYEKEFGKEIYKRSINIIYKYLSNKDSTLIINMKSPYITRTIRNENRAKNGGHYVSETTMKQVYSQDCFYSEKYKNFSILNIDNRRILVCNMINKQVDDDKIKKYMSKKINSIIKQYNKFKEESYGFKKVTKRDIAK